MRKKKLLSLALAVVMALGMLTGCGSKEEPAAPAATSTEVKELGQGTADLAPACRLGLLSGP